MPSSVDRYTVSVVIEGELEGDGAGSVVTGLGDLDGDGYGEIGIGASSHLHLGDANSGAVYVLFGLPL